MFNQNVYKRRFTSQRSYTRVDKFRALLVRYDWRNLYFFAAHYIAFAIINLRIVTDFEIFNDEVLHWRHCLHNNRLVNAFITMCQAL